MAELRLKLQLVAGPTYEVSWTDSRDASFVYRVDGDQLVSIAGDLRKQLDRLLQAYIRDPHGEVVALATRRLLQHGHDLFKSLFVALDDAPAALGALQQYRELAADGGLSIWVKVAPTLSIPWALVVPEIKDRAAASVDAVCADPSAPHQLFWGLRHELSVSAVHTRGAPRPKLARDQTKALAAMHRKLYEAVAASELNPSERRLVDLLSQRFDGGLTYDFETFLEAMDSAGSDRHASLRLGYLYGHANGERFQLSESDDISAGMLEARLADIDNQAPDQHTLLFLNGCQTVADTAIFPFTRLLGRSRVSGLIGTEVRVPDLFGFRFALAFFRLVMYEGLSFRRALTQLRRDHLPLSLAYSLYAADGLSLAAEHDAALEAPDGAMPSNLSKERVKCGP